MFRHHVFLGVESTPQLLCAESTPYAFHPKKEVQEKIIDGGRLTLEIYARQFKILPAGRVWQMFSKGHCSAPVESGC